MPEVFFFIIKTAIERNPTHLPLGEKVDDLQNEATISHLNKMRFNNINALVQ